MILLLDADETYRCEVARSLREHGHSVTDFASAEDLGPLEGLSGADAVILDYRLGTTDGLGLADRFHELYPSVPMLMTTEHRDDALRAGVHNRDYLFFFCKPLSSAALCNVVDVLMSTLEPEVGDLEVSFGVAATVAQ